MENDFNKNVAIRLKHLRAQSPLSRGAICEKIAITLQSMSRYENGHAVPPGEILIRFAKLYNVSTDYILKGEEKSPLSVVREPQAPYGINKDCQEQLAFKDAIIKELLEKLEIEKAKNQN